MGQTSDFLNFPATLAAEMSYYNGIVSCEDAGFCGVSVAEEEGSRFGLGFGLGFGLACYGVCHDGDELRI
jgi:hypothetical protein